jgi:hypothetical protein
VNCRQARQLITPLVDQELTGQQMFEVQTHLANCAYCAEEYRVLQQMKLVLRSLSTQRPVTPLETRIVTSLNREFSGQRTTQIIMQISYRPQRGRRLVTALALSCVGILVAAAPFAPGTVTMTSLRPIRNSYNNMMNLSSLQFLNLRPSGIEANQVIVQPVIMNGPAMRVEPAFHRYPAHFADSAPSMPMQNLNVVPFSNNPSQKNISMASITQY